VGFLSGLLARRNARKKPTARRAGQAKGRRRKRDNVVYSVERSITTTFVSGPKKRSSGRTKSKTTTEFRHGKCPVRHRTKQAAVRCPHP
jgi:hypothetical protein